MFSVRGSRVLLARVISGSLLAGLFLSGCGAGDRDGTSAPLIGESSPGSRSSSSSSSASVEPATDVSGDCTVPGFTSSTRITVTDLKPAVVYARSYTLPPGGSVHTVGLAPAERLDYVPIGTRAAADSARLSDADRDDVLRSGGGEVRGGRIKERVLVPVRIANHTQGNRSYLVYRGAMAESGSWKLRVCGAPYNDGSRVITVRGTFDSIGPLGPVRTAACGVVSAHANVIQRHAARRACA